MASQPSDTHTRPIELYGIFGTVVTYQPGNLISDEHGNWYQVTEPSTFCTEINRYSKGKRQKR
jgi:hypothetical protein